MYKKDEIIDVLSQADELLFESFSEQGVALLLLLFVDYSSHQVKLNSDQHKSVQAFIQQASLLLTGEKIASLVFEEMILSKHSAQGFLPNSESDSNNAQFWRLLTSVCCWYGSAAAQISGQVSYLNGIAKPRSINRIFYHWPEYKNKNQLNPSLLEFLTKALNYVLVYFPKNSHEELLFRLNYETEKQKFEDRASIKVDLK